jgi:hypothetical protein
MAQVRVDSVAILWYDVPQPQVRVSYIETVSGQLPPIRFRLTTEGWVPLETSRL